MLDPLSLAWYLGSFQDEKIHGYCCQPYNRSNPIVSQGLHDFFVMLWTDFFIDERLVFTILNFTNGFSLAQSC